MGSTKRWIGIRVENSYGSDCYDFYRDGKCMNEEFICDALNELEEVKAALYAARLALAELSLGKGPFNSDMRQFMENVIEKSKQTAISALKGEWEPDEYDVDDLEAIANRYAAERTNA